MKPRPLRLLLLSPTLLGLLLFRPTAVAAGALRRGGAAGGPVPDSDPSEEGVPLPDSASLLGERDLMDLLLSPPRAGPTPPDQRVRLLPGVNLTTEVLDAIVIGAGWAGLGAARALDQKGLKVAVLEARDYVGGRTRTVGLNGTLVELGSQWIEGTSSSNPIYTLAQSIPTPVLKSGVYNDGYWSSEYQSSTPHRVTDAEYNRVYKALYQDGWFPFMAKRQDSTSTDSSLRATTDLYIQQKGLGANDRRALEMLLDENVVQEYAASLQDLSTWWWDSDYDIGGSDAILKEGYGNLVDHYARTLLDRIYTNAPVSRIDYTNDIATVTYKNGGVNSTVRAYNVIVTVPLGVLQAKTITFVPALPSWKQTSIDRLGMGLLNKLIMKWDNTTTLPWPKDAEWLEKIATPQGRWTEFYNFQPVTGQNVLVAFSAGREAERAENMTDAAILTEALASLKGMFGVTVPTPRNYLVTRWKKDAYARGAYSYYKLGSKPRDRQNLATAVNGRLFFAGEACHMDYPSTTHGALMTGLQAGAAAAARRRQWRK